MAQAFLLVSKQDWLNLVLLKSFANIFIIFLSVWSTLYLLVNGKAAIKSLRPLPAVLSGLAGFNAIYYGKRFFFSTSSPTNTA